jgi:large subunit ribosomal protein L6
MSRIGKRPVAIPSGVQVKEAGGRIEVKGPKGVLSDAVPRGVQVEVSASEVRFQRADDRKPSRALHGLARALVNNMISGVTQGFVKQLEIQGVGYRAEVSGGALTLSLGFSHPVKVEIPKGLQVSVDKNTLIRIEGIDRHQVGQFSADLRALRPPEPYKGKGIRYVGEYVRRKVGKAGAS